MAYLQAPNKEFTGTVFEHSFVEGEAKLEKKDVKKEHLAYFERRGYKWETKSQKETPDETPGE